MALREMHDIPPPTIYTWANGPIAKGITLDHLCRNRAFAFGKEDDTAAG